MLADCAPEPPAATGAAAGATTSVGGGGGSTDLPVGTVVFKKTAIVVGRAGAAMAECEVCAKELRAGERVVNGALVARPRPGELACTPPYKGVATRVEIPESAASTGPVVAPLIPCFLFE